MRPWQKTSHVMSLLLEICYSHRSSRKLSHGSVLNRNNSYGSNFMLSVINYSRRILTCFCKEVCGYNSITYR
jgi:hypothetical protein